MFDQETEAIAKCTELMQELDPEARFRVQFLIERFDLASTSVTYSPFAASPS